LHNDRVRSQCERHMGTEGTESGGFTAQYILCLFRIQPLTCLTIPTTTSLFSLLACNDSPTSKLMARTRRLLEKSFAMRFSSSSSKAWYVHYCPFRESNLEHMHFIKILARVSDPSLKNGPFRQAMFDSHLALLHD